jgi:hypothetical protein
VPEEGLTIEHLVLADRKLVAEAMEANAARKKGQGFAGAAGD